MLKEKIRGKYEKPILIELGKVEELVSGSGSGATEEFSRTCDAGGYEGTYTIKQPIAKM